MVVLDRIHATKDPMYPDEYIVTVFWCDPLRDSRSGIVHTSRDHGVKLTDLLRLSERLRKMGFTPEGDVVDSYDAY